MTENSVIIIGLDLEEHPDIEQALSNNYTLQDELYDKNIEVLGLDGECWAIGLILSANDEEYVKKIKLSEIKNYKSKIPSLLKLLKELDNNLFGYLTEDDIGLFHTQRITG